MSKKKTHEEYVKELAIKNPDIDVIENYIDNETKILHRCKIHNIEWMIKPANALRGKGCQLCKIDKIKVNKKKQYEQYITELSVINPDIDIIGLYINANTPVMHRCKKHNIEWMIRPADALRGHGCEQCKKEKFIDSKTRTQEEYINELKIKNPNIDVIGMYISAKTPILHKCKICENQWLVRPDQILNGGHGCPICNISHGEKEISDYLIDNSIFFIPQYTFDDCRYKKVLPFDFYLPDYNACIEYDGQQHFEQIDFFGGEEKFKKTIQRDEIKTNYCLVNNIRLLRISYDENVIEALERFFGETKINEGGSIACLGLKSL